MKSALLATLMGGFLLALAPAPASAYYCRASSPTGSWGEGWHNYSLGYARRRALNECAIRTPRRFTCYLNYCN